MIEEIRNIKSGKEQLRQFGITIAVALGFLAGLFFLRGKDYFLYFLIFSAAFLALGLIRPSLLRPIQKIWMSLAIVMGWLVTRVILLLLFYLVVTPLGILARVFGKSFLDTKLDRAANSYWLSRGPNSLDPASCENQF